jgi:hypothetical protein
VTAAATRVGAPPSRSAVTIVGVCIAVAVVSLAVPASLAYDAWAWLVWGREVAARALDTTAGPAWKPLPVVVTTALSAFGGAAPALWLVITRTAGLLALVAAYRLAARFAGAVAGVVAALLLLVSPDGDPRYLRLVLEGHTAPLSAALTLWAVECHLAHRRAAAFLCVLVLSLDRPEAWPFLLGYGVWLWLRDPGHRWLVTTGCALVPVLWFGGDWWGSGSPLHGAGAAQVSAGDDGRLGDALARVADVVAAPGWLLAVVAVVDGRRRGERALAGLAALAAAWFLLVVVMSAAFGYAALTRFLLPGAALVCVLAGIGCVRAWEWLRAHSSRALATTALVALILPFVLIRAIGMAGVVSEVVERDRAVDDLDVAIAQAGGRDSVVRCGRVAIDDLGVPRLALAWKLDVPIHDVRRPGRRAAVTFLSTRPRDAEPRRRPPPVTGTVVARTSAWEVVDPECDDGNTGRRARVGS